MDSQFNGPMGVTVGHDGTVYVSDQGNHRVRMIRNGQVSTLAGNGQGGYADGAAAQAPFNGPGVAVGHDGTVYVTGGHRVRTIRNGQVSTLAGNGQGGYADGAAAQAPFNGPAGVAVGHDGTVYVADHNNHRVRMIRNGQVSTLAGNGQYGYADGAAAQAQFYYPYGVAVGHDGTVYVADCSNHRMRMIRNGQVSTLAGNGQGGYADGAAAQAQFNGPVGVAVGHDGTVYVADHNNHRVRMIRNGQVSTLAGNGQYGYADGAAAQAQFYYPYGVAVGHDGTVYVADCSNHRVRMIRNGQVSTLAGNGQLGYADGAAAIIRVSWIPSPTAFMLHQSLNVSTDVSVPVNDVQLRFHRSFIDIRCPSLLKASLRVQPVDAESISLFHKFVYTDGLPDNLKLRQQMGLAYLLLAADMKAHALALLSQLQQYPSTEQQRSSLNMQELVELYCYSLDLNPYEQGHKAALYLLQKHAAQLRPHMKSLPQWLGKHADKVMDLMQELLIPFDTIQPPISQQEVLSAKGNFLSVKESLEKLYAERDRGDFEILIKGCKAEKVHSYVVYAMWPYFRRMYDANMKEKQQQRLELPAVGDDGGMSPEVLQLIIELCYKPGELKQERVNAAVAIQILAVANLYLGDLDADESKVSVFDSLVELAQSQVVNGLTLDVCIDVFKQATHYGLEEIGEKAREMISNNIKTLLANPNHRKAIRSLPSEMQWDLVWTCLAK